MVEILLPASLVSLILLVWFRSSAFEEYAKLFGLGNLFYIHVYEERLKKNPVDTYQDFLLKNFSCFLIRLITCPLCWSVWLSLVSSLSVNNIYLLPLHNVLGLLLYGLVNKAMEE